MHRIHANHRPGQRLIVEVNETEIYGLLHDLNPAVLDAYGFALQLIEILREARDDFQRGTAPRRRSAQPERGGSWPLHGPGYTPAQLLGADDEGHTRRSDPGRAGRPSTPRSPPA
ncbi:hypothetical protein [Streptomyces sp. NBC_00829]|uniref:hypothetical protein n=1 Tax=Streptomyces sp. NBC_00829 TaxID=2903679 RepID=UPI002F90F700|nr:hypothetical protein OG293_40825 [Streptomyces sp. NBC_00829]